MAINQELLRELKEAQQTIFRVRVAIAKDLEANGITKEELHEIIDYTIKMFEDAVKIMQGHSSSYHKHVKISLEDKEKKQGFLTSLHEKYVMACLESDINNAVSEIQEAIDRLEELKKLSA